MLELPSDPVRVSTSLPSSPSSCWAAAHVADSGLSVKRESSVGCKGPSSWRESWGSRRMVKILMTMEEGATRGTRWDIVHSRDRSLAAKLARLCSCYWVTLTTLSESCDRMISSAGTWRRQQGLISNFNCRNNKTLLHNKQQQLEEDFLFVNILFWQAWFSPHYHLHKQIERRWHCQKRIFADEGILIKIALHSPYIQWWEHK